MLDQDYQWPSSSLNYFKNNNDFSSESVEKLINKIEDFFSQQYDCYVCLMPSGRSSISIILRYLNFTRSKTVFIPKWSSNCLYSSIGPYSNVSTDLIDPDLILVNHKWGYGYQLHQDYSKKIIIEDSVDTIHLDNSSLFQNNGIAEIISLPKIIGSFSGGLILIITSYYYLNLLYITYLSLIFLVGFLSDIKIMNSPKLRFIIQTLVVLGVIYFSSITVPQTKIIFLDQYPLLC